MAEMKESDTGCGEDQTALAGAIQAIDKRSVHRICSGQVVLTLATAVKELIENSIDAGGTTVEVKLRDYGSQLVEVIDNGSGVEEKNFEALTLKHHTSKLQDFSDLVGVETFGFRGEALSSLCALSGLTVVTRHSSSDVGTKLEFDHNGRVVNKTAQARQVGTTVILQNIFSTLPVRHKEFQRNIKKEFSKMVNVLNSYCIISTNVRITCSNQTLKGQRSIVVSSQGNSSLRENISNVFGPKQLCSVLEIKQQSPSEEVSCEFGLGSSTKPPFRLEGYISKCVHGQGRSSADRQYFFINKRPCDSTKLSKVINEVYHQYNRHQYPFVVLHVTMARDTVDVNVTPDKRQIFLQDEKLLLASLKTSLLALYQPTVGVLQYKPVHTSLSTESLTKGLEVRNHTNRSTEKQETVHPDTPISSLSRLKRTYASVFSTTDDSPTKEQAQVSKQRKLDTFVTRKTLAPSESNLDLTQTKVILEDNTIIVDSEDVGAGSQQDMPTDCESGTSSTLGSQNQSLQDTFNAGSQVQSSLGTLTVELHGHSFQDTSTLGSPGQSSQDTSTVGSLGQSSQDTSTVGSLGQSSQDTSTVGSLGQSSQGSLTPGFHCQMSEETVNWNSPDQNLNDGSSQSEDLKLSPDDVSEENVISSSNCCKTFKTSLAHNNLDVSVFACGSKSSERHIGDIQPTSSSTYDKHLPDIGPSTSKHQKYLSDLADRRSEDDLGEKQNKEWVSPGGGGGGGGDETQVTEFDESEAEYRHEKTVEFCLSSLRTKSSKRQKTVNANRSKSGEFYRTFRANITPTDNQSAEEELQREITQDMFDKMEILGQFNLGFIIVKNGEDLFIIDQHATDEKYNFEQLQQHTVLQSQRLIQPKNLELTASNETILIDNLEIFHQNGFDFLIDDQAPPTQRVKLVSTPVSKNWNFGKEDVEEMIFMLSDSPGVTCRPSRVKQMFASRSCRKSVMIGTALNKAEMKKLVSHMGEIKQPWNCPHGRPTMRHLINLNMVPQ